MFLFIRNQPVTDEILNTEYEYRPSNGLGTSEAHTRPSFYLDNKTAFKELFIRVQGIQHVRICQNLETVPSSSSQ
jgi:hypothetical protein